MDETAWLVESENGMYIGESMARGFPQFGFVSGHDNALRFARKEDAEAFIRLMPSINLALHEKAKGATEHMWVDVSDKLTQLQNEVSATEREAFERMV